MTCLASILLAVLAAGPGVDLIAHRGESADAPENTLAAFRLAWERGVPAIELDVHLTRDGALICSHDADLKRTAGSPLVIAESNLETLQALDVGRWKALRWAGERMPTLEEALATIPDGRRCFIEVKIGPEAVPALVEAVRSSGKKPAQLAIISFQAETIAEAKRWLPDLDAYFLASFKQDKTTGAWTPTADQLIAQAREIGADGLDLAAKGPIDGEFVRRVEAAGFPVYVWTVDDPAEARRLIEAGVSGITTNRAEWLGRQLWGEASRPRP